MNSGCGKDFANIVDENYKLHPRDQLVGLINVVCAWRVSDDTARVVSGNKCLFCANDLWLRKCFVCNE